MKKITLLFFYLFSTILIAQNKETTYNKWLFKIGANIVDNSGDTNPFNGLDLKKMGFSNNYAAGIDYRFHRHWSVGLFASNNRFVANRAELDGVIISKDMKYFATDLNLKYYLWGAEYENINSNRFNIYLSGGVGSFKIVDSSISLNFGGGLIYWLNDSFALNLESVAKWATKSNVQFDSNHFQHFAGITYRHNGKKDRDNDGIEDSKDNCPDTFGIAEFNGCPDSDNDGIIDSEDGCPEVAGLKANNGCPDSDKDGVIDSKDKCKNTYGPKENNGCPYKDSDNDGILDKDDKCPNTKGFLDNNGCPKEEVKEIVDKVETTNKTLENFSKAIYFKTGKYKFEYKTYAILKEVVTTLKEYPNAEVLIEGHTDNTGNPNSNELLSQKRADAVKKYLVKNGVEKGKITAIGFGQNQPKATNSNEKGRALNRRVIIKIK